MSVFDTAFRAVIGVEGGYSSNPLDPGNWTSGKCSSGLCKGTKYGISAASYPTLDIAALTLSDAQQIYRRDYWERAAADHIPPPLALLVFDAAVNSGVDRAVKWLQASLKVTVDGIAGPRTLAAAQQCQGAGAAILAEYQAQRLLFLSSLPTWRIFGLGWTRRICTIQLEALRVGEGN